MLRLDEAQLASGRLLFGHPLLPDETVEIDLFHDDRRRSLAEMHTRAIPWLDGQAYLVTLHFTQEKVRLREQLLKSSKQLNAVIAASPLAIVALDTAGRVTLWNHAATQMYGWHDHEVLGQHAPITSSSSAQLLDMLAGDALQGSPLKGKELHGQLRRDGKEIDLLVWSSVINDSHGLPSGVMLILSDISERRRARAHLRSLVGRDPLTSLPDRRHFRKSLRRAVMERKKARADTPLMVLQLDLDRFKTVNHSVGQSGGDHLLQMVAQRLAGKLYEADLLARTGSDEVTVLLTHAPQLQDCARVADRLLGMFDAPFEHDGEQYYLTASIGIAVYPHDGHKADELLGAADKALGRAKENGGNCVQFFTADLDQRARNQLAMEGKLKQAIARNELYLVYQPQFGMRCGQARGVEALLRWRHPLLGEISPAEFIPIAEKSGAIHNIGAWVLQTACRQLRAWDEQHRPRLRMAVNVSARQFYGRNFLQETMRIIEQSGIEPGRIELELTESILVDNLENARRILAELKALGVRISIDDFGTMFSSLTYLAHLPIDTLKIDQGFVREIEQMPKMGAIVQAIGDLARGLDLHVIAEGVETFAQLEFLRGIHCHEVQGYLLGRPLPPEQIAERLQEGQAHPLMQAAGRHGPG
jgi:diguanylate cyclase (GGDEF)-like protein/PAS domain S-box-containing protein